METTSSLDDTLPTMDSEDIEISTLEYNKLKDRADTYDDVVSKLKVLFQSITLVNGRIVEIKPQITPAIKGSKRVPIPTSLDDIKGFAYYFNKECNKKFSKHPNKIDDIGFRVDTGNMVDMTGKHFSTISDNLQTYRFQLPYEPYTFNIIVNKNDNTANGLISLLSEYESTAKAQASLKM
jgi:hypothetical protein